MPTNDTWLRQQAFGDGADSLQPVKLQSQQNVVSYLRSILTDTSGARLIHGPTSSGKSTIVREFVAGLPHDVACAVVDGSGRSPQALLSDVLSQFGYELHMESADDLLRMTKVFAVQQTRVCQSPIVIVENIESMQPASLRVLCLLASLRFQNQFAVRIVLTGDGRAPHLLKSEGMAPISRRTVAACEIEPFSTRESMFYLHGRLRACGVDQPDIMLPMDACDEIYRMSAGLPGRLNRNAVTVLEQRASAQPGAADSRESPPAQADGPSPPELIVTCNGETVGHHAFREKKVTIGRSKLADIVIDNEYASKFHAMVMVFADALVLVDLNSSNGTFVNSVKVSSTILRSDDIISLANHRIKVVNAPEADGERIRAARATDTAKMKTLEEMREQRKSRFAFFDRKRKAGG